MVKYEQSSRPHVFIKVRVELRYKYKYKHPSRPSTAAAGGGTAIVAHLKKVHRFRHLNWEGWVCVLAEILGRLTAGVRKEVYICGLPNKACGCGP